MCECGFSLLFVMIWRGRNKSSTNKRMVISIHICTALYHRLISSHPALVNAIILVLHSVAGSMPTQSSASSSRNVSASSYSDMPGEQGGWRRKNKNMQHEGSFQDSLSYTINCFTWLLLSGRRLHVWGHVWRWGRYPVRESLCLMLNIRYYGQEDRLHSLMYFCV